MDLNKPITFKKDKSAKSAGSSASGKAKPDKASKTPKAPKPEKAAGQSRSLKNTDIKDLFKGDLSKKKGVKYPTKTTINLARNENAEKQNRSRRLIAAVALLAIVLIGKFGVLDQLSRVRAAEAAYELVHDDYLSVVTAKEKYDQVLMEYRTYSMKWMEGDDSGKYVSVDRSDILDLVQNQLMTKATVKSIQIGGSTLVVAMSGMNLAQISQMFDSLREQSIVSNVTLGRTQSIDNSDSLSFTVTIALQPAGQEE